ncbi:MAG: FHA domain-containing protein [Polyangiaceae bacterium]
MSTETHFATTSSAVEDASGAPPSSRARPRVALPPGAPIVELSVVMPDGSVNTTRGRCAGRVLTLGREFRVARPHLVVINHPHVSATHAKLLVDSYGTMSVADAGSTNGTYLAGVALDGAWHALAPDCTFAIANLRVTARVVGIEDGTSSSEPESASLRPAARAPLDRGTEPCPIELEAAVIRVEFVTPEGYSYVTRARAFAGFVYFGRDRDHDAGRHWVSIDHPHVSREHASLDVDHQGRLSVRDLGSRNGTYVGGQRTEGSVPLGPDGEFHLGDVMVNAHFLGFEEVYPERRPLPPRNEKASPQKPSVPPTAQESSRGSWMDWVKRRLSGE